MCVCGGGGGGCGPAVPPSGTVHEINFACGHLVGKG